MCRRQVTRGRGALLVARVRAVGGRGEGGSVGGAWEGGLWGC